MLTWQNNKQADNSPVPAQDQVLNAPAVFATARDIASAISHLHSQGHLHGHLSADRYACPTLNRH